MSDYFCTQCGQRLTGAVRFCSNCGSPVDIETTGKSGRSIKGIGLFERLGLKSPARGATRETDSQKVEGVTASVLNDLLSCSLLNAPLNTDFLLAEDPRKMRLVRPLQCLHDMKRLKVSWGLTVYYSMAGPYCPLDECDRNDFPEGVADAYRKAENLSHLEMAIHPSFEPQDYGEIDAHRGRWRTVQLTGEDKRYEVVMVAPLTPSGSIMKRRLREHEAYLSQWLAKEGDSETKKTLEEIRKSVRISIQAIPDGFADHIVCEAYVVEDGRVQSLALMKEYEEEDGEEEGETSAEKSIAFRETSRLIAANDSFGRKWMGGSTGGRRAAVPRIEAIPPFWRVR